MKMKDRNTAAQFVILLHKPLSVWETTPSADFDRLCFCTRLRLLRKIALEKGFVFTHRETEPLLLSTEKGDYVLLSAAHRHLPGWSISISVPLPDLMQRI